jgi:Short C-terminal domain
MLFLYRPRETRMPFYLPRRESTQAAYYWGLQDQFEATRRVPPPAPTGGDGAPRSDDTDVVEKLERAASLHRSGALDDAEFEALKAKLLGR